MKIGMNILYERLNDWDPVFDCRQPNGKKLMGALLVDHGICPLEGHVLIGTAAYFNEQNNLSDENMIVLGKPNEIVLDQNTCIYLPETVDIYKVFADVQQIFMRLELWNEKLTKAVFDHASLEELCTLSIPAFENPIFIHDPNFIVLANVNEMSGQFDWFYDTNSHKYSLPMDIMNDFKFSEEYQRTMGTRGSHMFSEQQFGYRILYINLWFEESYLGRICISELGRQIVDGDYELLEHFAVAVLAAMRQRDMLQSDASNDLKQSFLELMVSKKTNEVLLLNRLQAIGWNIDDRYFCVSIYMQKWDYSTNAIDYNCYRLENMFPSYCIFLYKDRILMVANQNKSEISKDDFFTTLAVFLREGLFKASVSSTGHDFRLFWYYFNQTEIAYRIGSLKDPMFWLYKFSDYKLQYILEQATNEMMPIMLCESSLLNLLSYDQKHNSNFFETLHVYLQQERNLAETTRLMFVHRSTLLYRIDKIRSIINVNLDDPKIRMHLLISYELLNNMPPELD